MILNTTEPENFYHNKLDPILLVKLVYAKGFEKRHSIPLKYRFEKMDNSFTEWLDYKLPSGATFQDGKNGTIMINAPIEGSNNAIKVWFKAQAENGVDFDMFFDFTAHSPLKPIPISYLEYTFTLLQFHENAEHMLTQLSAISEQIEGCKVYLSGNYFVYDIEAKRLTEIRCFESLSDRKAINAIIGFYRFLKPSEKK